MKLLLLMAIILCPVVVFFWVFGFTLVCGRSMYPTFKDGDILLYRRIYTAFERPKRDSIYFYKRGDITVVKRLSGFYKENGKYFCYFLGDNPPESDDSRRYGYIEWGDVKKKFVGFVYKDDSDGVFNRKEN